MDPKLRAPRGQGLKSPAGGAGGAVPPPSRRGRDGLQEVGKVQGAGGGRGRWRFRRGQNESCKLQPSCKHWGDCIRLEAGGFMPAGEEIPSQSRKDFDVHLPNLPPLLVLERARPGPKALGSLPVCTARGLGSPGPRRSLPQGPTLDGPCLLSWARLFLEMSSLSLSYPLQSNGQVGKITDFFSPRRIKRPASQGKFYKPMMSMMQGKDHTV